MLPMVAGCRLDRKAPPASISGDAATESILLQGKEASADSFFNHPNALAKKEYLF